MDDLISRQAAIDAISHCMCTDGFRSSEGCIHKQTAYTALKRLPATQPEIIRCKDCKHWIPYDWMFSEVWRSKNIADYPEDEIWCNFCDVAMKANDFCSRGERRENG